MHIKPILKPRGNIIKYYCETQKITLPQAKGLKIPQVFQVLTSDRTQLKD